MEPESREHRAQIVYFSHGGGPLPILGDPSHKAMVEFMVALPGLLRRPEVILVISAHWEERNPTLLGAERPVMFYDYYGFPPQAYEIQYPAPGSPALAQRIGAMLRAAGLDPRIDGQRGFDHGLFIPLKLMYPRADIPAFQLSLLRGLDPAAHIALGKALRGLKEQAVLVIGSGFSYHNLRAFFGRDAEAPDPDNDAFQDWVIETCSGQHDQSEREKRLIRWEHAPSARYCHPREEHLLPVHVCVGMAEKPATVIFDDRILHKRSVAFVW